jgi:hydrogenase small subunit
MAEISRREFLRMGAVLAAGAGLGSDAAQALAAGLERVFTGQKRVVWLQGMSCTGCSVSLLNSDEPGPVELITQVISVVFHPNLSAAQGHLVTETLDRLVEAGDFFLVLEGAICPKMPQACTVAGRPLTDLLPPLLKRAQFIVTAGSCAAFGGIPGADGNPTGAMGLKEFMIDRGIPVENKLVNCPGCPVHPHTIVTTLAYLAGAGYPAVDPVTLTPNMICSASVHDDCPRFHHWQKQHFAEHFGDEGCLFKLGCLGPLSRSNCSHRQWNGGINWCIRAGAPCIACTSEDFAKRKSFPFYRHGEKYHPVAYGDADRKGTTT